MGRNLFYYFLATGSAICAGLSPASAQEKLWPGDVNNNGVVNVVDLLYLGQAYSIMGPARTNPSTNWEPQDIIPWAQSFPNGTNYAFADCNGDGAVDDADLDSGIEDNFGETHGNLLSDGFLNGTAGSAPQAGLAPSATIVQPGAQVEISLSLGDQGFPIPSFYGIALLLSYDNELLGGDDAFEFEFEEEGNSWINTPKIEYFFHDDDDDPGKAQVAITRTDRQAQGPGFGQIGKFSIVIEDIIVGLEVDTFKLQVDSVLLIGEDFNTYPAVPGKAIILIARDSALVGASSGHSDSDVKIFPNPASGFFHIQCTAGLAELYLLDALGRTIPLSIHSSGKHTYRADTSGLTPGLYWAVGRTNEGSFRKKISIF